MFNVAERDILGDNRFTNMVEARYAIYHALKAAGATQQQIAKWMRKNHSSVHHALRVFPGRLDSGDIVLRCAVERLTKYAKGVCGDKQV